MGSEYDRTKDQKTAEAIAFSDEKTRLVVEIVSYNAGPRKIQISRFRHDRFSKHMEPSKLGRFTYQEFCAVARCVKALAEKNEI